MNYVELHVTGRPYSEEAMEIAIAELALINFESFAEAGRGIYAYIPAPDFNEEKVKKLLQDLTATRYSYTFRELPEQNWNALWESNFEPVVVDGRCTICAPFHRNLTPTELMVIVVPKMAFGTGHHATTYLCVQALLRREVRGLRVLDMGCGTGVLAIAAARRGAAQVHAIDVEECSYRAALENVKLNGVADRVTVTLGSAQLIAAFKYDLIMANISRNVLLQDVPRYAQSLEPGGTLLLSGIYTTDANAVLQAAQACGLSLAAQQEREGWVCMEVRMA